MDANKLRSEVFDKTGIKVDTTDPIFALVALNEAVLADYATQNLAGLADATETLKEQTRLLLEAGERAKALLLQMGHKVDDPAPVAAMPASAAVAAPASPTLTMPPLVLASVTALLAAVLVVAGQALFAPARAQPATPAATQMPAPTLALTPEQQKMMQTGEKFTKAWPQLDAKTQARLHDLMQ